jgi:hypothetical protein
VTAAASYPPDWEADARASLEEATGPWTADELEEWEAVEQTQGNGRYRPASAASWRPVDLLGALTADHSPLLPTLLHRSDGVALLYAGKVHSFVGEHETGKSWVTQYAIAEHLNAGGTALNIDAEKDARDVVTRMMALGVKPQVMAERLIYVRPEEPFSPAAHAELMAGIKDRPVGLTVIDSVEALMTASSLDPSSRRDYGGWHFQFVRPLQLATAGPTVLVDHPIKDTEKRGAWASGAGNKMALIDVSFLVEGMAKFGRGREGAARIRIAKDSPAALRQHELSTGGVAVFRLAEADGEVVAELLAASAPTTAAKQAFRPTALMERVSTYVAGREVPPSQYGILSEVTGKRDYLRLAIRCLVAEGYLAQEDGARGGSTFRFLRPYSEADESTVSPPDRVPARHRVPSPPF